MMAISDHQLGKLILCVSITFFCYYTLWLWVPPFISSSSSTVISSRFFPPVRYALFLPALTGLIFNGVTCGGKTTLTSQLKNLLIEYYRSKKCVVTISSISQDEFFLKPDDPRHVYLPSLGHNNWELPTAVDLDVMHKTVQEIVGDKAEMKYAEAVHSIKHRLKGILLIEGFLVLNHKPTRSLCRMGYYLLLSRAVCQSRRSCRSYDPPDVPGYFEQCVWPEHVSRRVEIIGKGKLVDHSDPLSMSEVSQCSEEGTVVINQCFSETSASKDVPNELIQKESDVNFVDKVSEFDEKGKQSVQTLAGISDCDDLWMVMGKGVLPLAGFGKAGLGMVNGIRVLNGAVIDKEELAQLVFKDVLQEIEKLNFD